MIRGVLLTDDLKRLFTKSLRDDGVGKLQPTQVHTVFAATRRCRSSGEKERGTAVMVSSSVEVPVVAITKKQES